MPALVDTNVLLRVRDAASVHHRSCVDLVNWSRGNRASLVLVPQVLVEYWAAVTRPVGSPNGFGLSPAQASADLDEFGRIFPLLPDHPDAHGRWRRLVDRYAVSGRPSHDARLVALMAAHGLTQLVTLNSADFVRFAPEGFTCVSPADFLAENGPSAP